MELILSGEQNEINVLFIRKTFFERITRKTLAATLKPYRRFSFWYHEGRKWNENFTSFSLQWNIFAKYLNSFDFIVCYFVDKIVQCNHGKTREKIFKIDTKKAASTFRCKLLIILCIEYNLSLMECFCNDANHNLLRKLYLILETPTHTQRHSSVSIIFLFVVHQLPASSEFNPFAFLFSFHSLFLCFRESIKQKRQGDELGNGKLNSTIAIDNVYKWMIHHLDMLYISLN